MSQPPSFWEQYKENLEAYNRSAPRRFLRLFVAFGMALLLAPCCAAAAAITGEPMAAMVVGVVGIGGGFAAWWLIARMFDRSPNQAAGQAYSPAGYPPPSYALPDYGLPQPPVDFPGQVGQSPFGPAAMSGLPPAKSGFETPFPTRQAGFVPPAYSAQLPGQAILGASSGPVPPFAAETQPARSGAGCAIAALTGAGLLGLSCCCGAPALLVTLPNLKVQVGPQQPLAGPPGNPFGFPGPMPGAMPNDPFPNNDPFAEMRGAQGKGFQDFIKENERQMRELGEQMRKQNERAFPPDF